MTSIYIHKVVYLLVNFYINKIPLKSEYCTFLPFSSKCTISFSREIFHAKIILRKMSNSPWPEDQLILWNSNTGLNLDDLRTWLLKPSTEFAECWNINEWMILFCLKFPFDCIPIYSKKFSYPYLDILHDSLMLEWFQKRK